MKGAGCLRGQRSYVYVAGGCQTPRVRRYNHQYHRQDRGTTVAIVYILTIVSTVTIVNIVAIVNLATIVNLVAIVNILTIVHVVIIVNI